MSYYYHVYRNEKRHVGNGREAPLELGFEIRHVVCEDEEVVASQHIHNLPKQLNIIGKPAIQWHKMAEVNNKHNIHKAYQHHLLRAIAL